MEMLSFIGVGVLMIGASSIGSGMIIRRLGRKQAGMPFYSVMLASGLTLAYGVLPLIQLNGMAKTAMYAVGLCTVVLVSQALVGQKIEAPKP